MRHFTVASLGLSVSVFRTLFGRSQTVFDLREVVIFPLPMPITYLSNGSSLTSSSIGITYQEVSFRSTSMQIGGLTVASAGSSQTSLLTWLLAGPVQ